MSPVLIKDNIIVVLRYEGFQTKMFAQERDQFWTGPIVCKLSCSDAFMSKHRVEKRLPETSSLHFLIYIEVKNTKGFHFDQVPIAVPNKEFLVAHFEEPNTLVPLSSHVARMIIRNDFGQCGYGLRQLLGLKFGSEISPNLPWHSLCPFSRLPSQVGRQRQYCARHIAF